MILDKPKEVILNVKPLFVLRKMRVLWCLGAVIKTLDLNGRDAKILYKVKAFCQAAG